MQVKHFDLFPTRMWVFDLPLAAQHPSWIARVEQWRAEAPTKGAAASNNGGWSSDKSLFHTEHFADLGLAAIEAFSAVLKALNRPSDTAFVMEAWFNILDSGAYNLPHTHGACLLSAVYYLQAPEGAGPIYFRDPRPAPALMRSRTGGLHSGREVSVLPAAGQLLVFPSWLEHGVSPNEATEPRISIAINAVREGRPPEPEND